MAREVILKLWCDPCLAEDQHNEGEELPPLALAGIPGRPRVLALCELHRKEFYEPLYELLAEHGQPVDEDGNPSGPRGKYKKAGSSSRTGAQEGDKLACLMTDCDHVALNRSALASHVRRQHETTLAELEGKSMDFECPECGKKAAAPQGLAAHRSRIHGVAGTSKH